MKFWAGKAKEKLLSGWVLGSSCKKVMLQIPQVGRCRATDPLAVVSSVPVFPCIDKEGITTAAHAMDHFKVFITECLPVPMSLDDQHSLQLAEASVAAAACKGSPRFHLFLKKDQKTLLLVVEPGMKLRHAVAAYVNEDQYLATIGGRLVGLDKTIAELGLLSGCTLQVVERLRGGGFPSGKGGFGRPVREEYVPIPGEWQCRNCHTVRCWPTRNAAIGVGAREESIVLLRKARALVSRWVLWVVWLLPGAQLSIPRIGWQRSWCWQSQSPGCRCWCWRSPGGRFVPKGSE